MKKFILNIIGFSMLVAVLALSLDFFVTSGLKKTEVGDFQVWNDIYNSRITGGVVISGSSRAARSINPAILDSALSVNSYNLGNDAYYFYMQYARYQVFAKHNPKPKLIIQTADFNTLWNTGSTNKVQFAPYNDPLLDSFLENIGFKPNELNTPVYRYFSEISAVKLGLANQLGLDKVFYKDKIRYKGYQATYNEWNRRELDNILNVSGKIKVHNQPEMAVLLDDFLSECKNNNIQVVMVFVPEYIEAINTTESTNATAVLDLYNSLSEKYNFPFLDYSRDTICNNIEYFYNALHLNSRGADLFTKKLARDIDLLGIMQEN
jgi:hypothetical protein